jgi:hypothetical protein
LVLLQVVAFLHFLAVVALRVGIVSVTVDIFFYLCLVLLGLFYFILDLTKVAVLVAVCVLVTAWNVVLVTVLIRAHVFVMHFELTAFGDAGFCFYLFWF